MHRDIQIGAQRISLQDRGTGTPVLLLHSSGMSSAQWRKLTLHMQSSHHVLAPDFIGYRHSAPWTGEGPFHFGSDLAVVEGVAEEAGAPVHLVGHSYGGFLALMAAARHRFPVASISVFEPVAFGVLYSAHDQKGIEEIEAIDAAGFFAPEMQGTVEWSEFFVNFWNGPGYWARLPDLMKRPFLDVGKKMFEEVRSIARDRTPHETYASITAPTLFITGSASPDIAHRTTAILARTIPNARVASVEGAGHMGPITHAAATNALIEGNIDAADRQ